MGGFRVLRPEDCVNHHHAEHWQTQDYEWILQVEWNPRARPNTTAEMRAIESGPVLRRDVASDVDTSLKDAAIPCKSSISIRWQN